jgi:hypothetical protein
MRVALRLVAAWLLVSAVAYLPGIWGISDGAAGFPLEAARYLLPLGVLAILAAGAGVELWRLRERGRLMALAYTVLASGGTVLVGLVEGEPWKAGSLIALALQLTAGLALLSPAAKRTCRCGQERTASRQGRAG